MVTEFFNYYFSLSIKLTGYPPQTLQKLPFHENIDLQKGHFFIVFDSLGISSLGGLKNFL